MGITLEKAIRAFSRESGDIEDRDLLIDRIVEGVEFVLLNGGGKILREWRVVARNGLFTFPRDLETPVKYKYGRLPNLGFGTVQSPYFSYSSAAVDITKDYCDWGKGIELKANSVCTQYQPPASGVFLCATTKNDEDVGKKIMVSGEYNGMSIAPRHNKHKTAGELLTIYHEDDPSKKYSAFLFQKITSVVKDETVDWVMLSGIEKNTQKFYFLSHYHPDEEVISYRQGELFDNSHHQDTLITILGRINPSARYLRDEDILPITSQGMLLLLAKRARYDELGDFKEVAAMEQRLKNTIRAQVAYQKAAMSTISVNLKGSGCSYTNI